MQDFETKIGPPPSGSSKSCSVSANPITDIFNAAKCLTDGLNKATDDITKAIDDGLTDLEDVTTDLTNVKGLEDALKNDQEDDDQKSQSDNNQSSQQTSDGKSTQTSTTTSSGSSSSGSSTSSGSSSSSSGCTMTHTASACRVSCPPSTANSTATDQCSTSCATMTGCSVSNSYTTIIGSTSSVPDACPYIPGVSTSVPADPAPNGPFVTAWFDYGLSCAGSNCGMFASGSGGSASKTAGSPSSVNATATASSTSVSSTGSASGSTSTSGSGDSTSSTASASSSASYTGPKPTCMSDGAPWMSPTAFCDCGPSATYPTLSLAGSVTDKDAICSYTSLDPSKTIQPITTTSPPTNIPGVGGVPGCAAVVWGPDHLDCPYASGINYCNCGGTFAPPLSTTGSFINCDYTTQPSSQNCPVNTAYSQSLVSASEAAAASRAATVFDPTHTTTSCGATWGVGTGATGAPRNDVDAITDGIKYFCTPPDGPLVLQKGKPASINFELPPGTPAIYQIAFEWDGRDECANHPAPSIVASVPKGPDYWCYTYFTDLLNGCDTADGQEKHGGRLFTDCAIVSFSLPPYRRFFLG